MARIAELVYINSQKIIFTNSKVDWAKIHRIARNIDGDLFKAIPAYPTERGYIITDGNHRVRAAKLAGYKFVPCVLLEKHEFEVLRKQKHMSIDILVSVPEKIKVLN
jgi:hypothetical protein